MNLILQKWYKRKKRKRNSENVMYKNTNPVGQKLENVLQNEVWKIHPSSCFKSWISKVLVLSWATHQILCGVPLCLPPFFSWKKTHNKVSRAGGKNEQGDSKSRILLGLSLDLWISFHFLFFLSLLLSPFSLQSFGLATDPNWESITSQILVGKIIECWARS